MGTTVIEVADVSKRFVIHKDKSLKERIVNRRRSTKHRDDFWALRDVSFEIEAGTTVGLIGANGSGKSTLLKMVGGILQPSTGTVRLRGRLAALLELGAGFHPDLTGRENVYLNAAILGLSAQQVDKYFEAIVDFSGIEPFIDTQVKFYSSGMYVRLAFAVAVHVDPDILLVDEVLAVGDEPFQRKCMDRIRAFQRDGRTIVMVTHALDQVAELCSRAIVLEHGRLIADDVPLQALRVLRSEFQATQIEDAAASAGDAPARDVSITGVEVISGGTAVTEVRPGGPVTVRVHVESARRLEGWVVGFGIENSAGQGIYGTNSQLLGAHLPPLLGSTSIDFEIPRLSLGEGNYTVHGAVVDSAGAELARLNEAIGLAVHSDGTEVGVLYLGASITGVRV